MSNSSLVKYTKLSPNNSGKRTHSIDRITPHCAVGQLSVESLGNIFQKTGDNAVSCNYAIGTDGRVALIVDESQRSWCSSSKANDQRAVTIECASDKTSPYAFNTTVYNQLIELCADICKRNGKTKLLWISDKDKALAYEPKDGEMLLTVHRWFANKACPGDWLMQRMGDLASKVTAKLAGSADSPIKYYRVRKSWGDADSQLGAYLIYENAKIKADEAGSRYAVFDWEGKEIYRAPVNTDKEITFFYPGYTRESSPYDSHGAGCVWHDNNKNCLIYDAYWKGRAACKRLIKYLKDNGLLTFDALVSHAHGDHGGGFFLMLEDGAFTIENFYCYDPDSLKLAGDGTQNGKSARDDKNYLLNLISKMEAAGAKIHYVKTGDEITCGEMVFEVCRNQPSSWGQYDTGEAWGYLNDGSINLYERACHVLLCGDGGGKKAAEYFNGDIAVCESEHHGNGDGAAKVAAVKKRGCGLAIECNYEKDGPGSCSWTRYGAGRFNDAGIPVWQLDADIIGTAKGGKLTVTQGSKKKTFDVPFGKVFYRVRKTWADEKSQIGAYTQLDKAKECVVQHPGYTAFDENGNAVYPAAESSGTQEQAQTSSGSSGKTQEQTQVTPNPNMDNEVFIQIIGELAQEDMAKSGVLASVTIAQAILESGWGKSELALNAKNLFGMKCSLSGNTWAGSTWDGKSAYNVTTGEYYSGTYTTVRRDFRRYKSWAESVADHSAYLTGAMNGSKLRYSGLKGQKDYRKAVQIIKDGDYATSPTYTTNLCNLIKKYNLTLYDSGSAETVPATTPTAPATPASISPKILAELMPVIGQGDKGKAVGVAQAILGGLELDSSFGPNTNASTIAFQKKKKLTQDGIIGKNTWTALFTAIKGGADKLPELKYGSSGKAVTALQVMLGGLEKDGSFGPKTEARLKAVTGQITTTYDVWNALISAL